MFANAFMVLLGAAAISVPILLHLLMRPQAQRLVFPAVRFLQVRERTNKRQLQWRHWLLLFLRCAVLFVLALVFARPHVASAAASTWAALGIWLLVTLALAVCWVVAWSRRLPAWLTGTLGAGSIVTLLLSLLALVQIARLGAGQAGWGTRQAPVAAAFVIDTSPRMLYRHEGQTRLERAQGLVNELLPQFPAQSDFVVLDRPEGSAQWTQDRGGVVKQFRALEVSGREFSIHDTARRALRMLLAHDHEQRELYLLTDMTAATWESGDRDALVKELNEAASVRVHLVDVGIADAENYSVIDVRPDQQQIAAGSQVEIVGTLRHVGRPGACNVEWLLEQLDPTKPYIRDGQLELPSTDVRARETVEFKGPGEQEIRFTAAGLEPGIHHGRVRILAGDALPIDDEAYFSLEVLSGWSVAVVAGPEAIARFLTTALGNPGASGSSEPGQGRFRATVLPQSGPWPASWDGYAIVTLLDPAPLSDQAWNGLRDYVLQGGRLMICLGRNARTEQFNTPAGLAVLPGPLKRIWRTEGVLLQPASDPHPSQRLFQRLATTVPWDTMPVFRHWTLGIGPDERKLAATPTTPSVEGPASASVEVPWRYTNSQPAIIERSLGLGKVVVMTTPISDAASDAESWNYLPTGIDNWPFVVLIDQWFSYLAQQDHAPLNYLVGEPAVANMPRTAQPVRYQLFSPRGEWHDVAGQAGRITVELTDQAGIYRVRASDLETPPRGFSVNLSPQAGRLDRVDPESLQAWIDTTHARLAADGGMLKREVSEARVGVDFFAYLLLVLAVILGLEGLLAAGFYPEPQVEHSTLAASASAAAAGERFDMGRAPSPTREVAMRGER